MLGLPEGGSGCGGKGETEEPHYHDELHTYINGHAINLHTRRWSCGGIVLHNYQKNDNKLQRKDLIIKPRSCCAIRIAMHYCTQDC